MRTHRIPEILAAAFVLAACGGGGSSGTTGGGGDGGGGSVGNTGFSLKGRLAATTQAQAQAAGPNAVAASSVTTVVAFSPNRYWTSSVTAGVFDIQVDPGEPVGLVFAGASSEFLGALLLPSGFAAIPLQARTAGVTSVDLGTLVAGANLFTPGHDPVGTEIQLDAAERATLRLLEGTFGAAIRNPDMDGDGRVDILQGRFYRPYVWYWVEGGGFGGGVAAAPAVPAGIAGFRIGMHVSDAGSLPPTVTFTGPAGSGLAGTPNDQPPGTGTGWATYSSPMVQAPAVPPGGPYTVSVGASTLSFDLGDQSSATAHVALSVPTVTLNGDGTVARLDWTYRLGDASGTVDPASLIHDLILQIDGDGTAGAPPCSANGGVASNQGGRAYNSPNLGATVTAHVLVCQDIRWSSVRSIYMAYNDVYGNHVVVAWRK